MEKATMRVRNLHLYQVLRLLTDAIAVACAWRLTVAMRILLNSVASQQVSIVEAKLWAPSLLLVLALWSLLAWRLGHYGAPAQQGWHRNLLSILEQSLLASMVVASITVFDRSIGVQASRAFMLIFLPTSFVTLALARFGALMLCLKTESMSFPPLRAALLGDCQVAAQLLGQMSPVRGDSIFKGLIVPEGQSAIEAPDTLRVLGTTTQLAEVINREQITEIIVLNSSMPHTEVERCGVVCKRLGMPMNFAFDLATGPARMNLSTFYGFPILEIVPLNVSKTRELLKRIFDVLLASIALAIAAPLMLMIAVAIKLDSEGPIFYRAPRVGKGGRHFICFKFRSMYTVTDRVQVSTANEKAGHIFKIKNDPRVTRVGYWLRRHSLDELPQIFNVLRNEMSIVGPRPLPAVDLDPDGMSRTFSEWAEGRARVQPGITGLWQIRGRSELPFEEMVRLDLEYIRNWSLLLDIKIIFDTPAIVLKGTGAY
jgi:exopolysaccharide biosynthesis polyprenyl glycosylphosphotransferase